MAAGNLLPVGPTQLFPITEMQAKDRKVERDHEDSI